MVDVQQARASLLENTSKLSKLGHEIQMSASFSEVSSHTMTRKEAVNRRSSLSSELRMEEPDESRWLLDHQSLESSILKEALHRKQVVGLVDRHLADAEQSSSDALVSGDVTSAEERDDASETGTYTIGKDSPSPDEEQSRRDIDRVFGLIPDADVSKMRSLSGLELDNRSTPNWIREWAAQVAQQQETSPSVATSVSKPPSAPRQSPAAPAETQIPSQRPRRRLPSVPPTAGSCRSRSSPRPSDMSDPSDSSLETESFLRDTESVVSAMQVLPSSSWSFRRLISFQ